MQLELASPQRRITIHGRQSPVVDTIDPVAGRMAHDLRNILQIISGNLALLARNLGDNVVARKHIDRAMAGVELGTRLAGSAIAGDRQASAGTDLLSARQSIESVLTDAVGSGIAVRVAMSASPAIVAVDRTALENVLINLAVNARHAMDGIGTLCVGFADHRIAGRRMIGMTVTDTGCGMSRTVIDRMFDPYYTTKGNAGSGLGLATVKRFAESCGGSIKVNSVVGAGTEIRIVMPALDAAA